MRRRGVLLVEAEEDRHRSTLTDARTADNISMSSAGRREAERAMRSATRSTASASALYWPSNMRCSVWNIGPMAFLVVGWGTACR